jgi:hypothetical protein
MHLMPVPLPIINQTFRCALRWFNSGGQFAVNVIHIHSTAAGKHASDAFAVLDGNVTAAMWNSAVATASITDVDITPLDGTSATQSFSTGSPAKWSGSAGGEFAPQVAGIVKLTTLTRGRANRGRVFLPFSAEAGMGQGAFTNAVITSVTTAWQNFAAALAALTPDAWELGVASYDRAHAGAGAHFTPVSTVAFEGETATQRRRQQRNR